ncbi:MAG: sigma-70 family RNA polymerase sigma factor [Bryobacterales bacterium]|nr:sigma-70 family RNA polymerase sigma factor [Bryobacterales bacterium]MDE0629626.1 sigma-70 family RNA polymerase sigma factor [Bryobacterales bacterium]
MWSASRASGASAAAMPLGGISGPRDGQIEAAAIGREVTLLFDALRTPVLRYLMSMGLPVADGEDVVQDTFLALFNHLRRGRPRTNLQGWTFRTAHNLGLKRRRAIHRSWKSSRDRAAAVLAADTRPNPEEQLNGRQEYERACAVLRALPERDRLCLALRAEGLRYRDIAKTLGISLGSVSKSISRAAARLQEARR